MPAVVTSARRFSTFAADSSTLSALYCPKFELSRFETISRVFMASMAAGQLAFEGAASDFQSLEEKIYRTIELLKAARAQKAAAELELATMREAFEAQTAETEALRQAAPSSAAGAHRGALPRRKASRRRRRDPRTMSAARRVRVPHICRFQQMWERSRGALAIVLDLVLICTCTCS